MQMESIPELEELSKNPEVLQEAEHIGRHLSGERYGVPTLAQLENICGSDETLSASLKDVVRYGVRYIISTVKYLSIDLKDTPRDEVAAVDGGKKHAHDAAIDAINILARNLKKQGCSVDWINGLRAGGRPAYARFALVIGFDAMHQ